MARIRLAHWHGGHRPGDEIDVADDEVAGLVRDGRVAEVVTAPSEPLAAAQTETAQEPAEQPAPSSSKRSSRKGD
ncbi:hypothetical protein LUW77_03505 [Streptomyces radiopugnans]|nr:hypothetical protein LUW77_03505 [Streptomyces radiopugnans]